eukprot:CAMPEP_0206233014 /NCGR_PEP_ID=MMETSP0047_2-20121206/11742_1 /ASSEMBLY_ACC=CAM_ASM_000192 /TAXON_ID=195065 /ORGANISM="Chroomonas mesostigmatica_cf, Strain CCMP1168" /LENGTH=174 /DNA_ID=CAMNT_0053656827 /DNA_START=197 /DNA_END=722 /DNA_ORIENTATION=-
MALAEAPGGSQDWQQRQLARSREAREPRPPRGGERGRILKDPEVVLRPHQPWAKCATASAGAVRARGLQPPPLCRDIGDAAARPDQGAPHAERRRIRGVLASGISWLAGEQNAVAPMPSFGKRETLWTMSKGTKAATLETKALQDWVLGAPPVRGKQLSRSLDAVCNTFVELVG